MRRKHLATAGTAGLQESCVVLAVALSVSEQALLNKTSIEHSHKEEIQPYRTHRHKNKNYKRQQLPLLKRGYFNSQDRLGLGREGGIDLRGIGYSCPSLQLFVYPTIKLFLPPPPTRGSAANLNDGNKTPLRATVAILPGCYS